MEHKATIFHRTHKPKKAELQNLVKHYEHMTAAMSDDEVMKLLDSSEKWHYLALLKIADYMPMGRTKTIIYAFKLGYLYAKGKIELGLPDYEAGKAGRHSDKK